MLKTFSLTDVGRRRSVNQDYVYTCEKPIGNLPNLFLVADGMGGHKAGDYASKYTVETMCRVIERSPEKDPEVILQQAIKAANEHIRQKALEDINLEGMGTTIVAATCLGNRLQVANVGDSRLYIVNKEIMQITHDHSLVEEMVRMGGIDRETARNHPDKNIITRAIGAGNSVEIDFFTRNLEKGDMILMCTDGLSNMLEDEEILMIMKGQRDLVEIAETLIREANNRGGRDNVSVVVIEPLGK